MLVQGVRCCPTGGKVGIFAMVVVHSFLILLCSLCVFLCYVVLHFGVSTLAHDLMCTPIGFGVSMCLSLWL